MGIQGLLFLRQAPNTINGKGILPVFKYCPSKKNYSILGKIV